MFLTINILGFNSCINIIQLKRAFISGLLKRAFIFLKRGGNENSKVKNTLCEREFQLVHKKYFNNQLKT